MSVFYLTAFQELGFEVYRNFKLSELAEAEIFSDMVKNGNYYADICNS